MDLYSVSFATFNQVQVEPPTCPYAYQFITLVKGNPLTMDSDEWKVMYNPLNYALDMGTHQYMIKACIVVEDQLTNCKNSALAEVNVIDPCVDT